jgi:hypothetical protein
MVFGDSSPRFVRQGGGYCRVIDADAPRDEIETSCAARIDALCENAAQERLQKRFADAKLNRLMQYGESSFSRFTNGIGDIAEGQP